MCVYFYIYITIEICTKPVRSQYNCLARINNS